MANDIAKNSPTTLSANKMGTKKMGKLIWSMGLPSILSMILQALYNVVDTAFVINMGADGAISNLALSAAFPVQILMIAIGVGTGVGINAMLSKNLGEGNKRAVDKTAGNGLFLIVIFYAAFLLFGAFLSKPYMKLMASDEKVIEAGTQYLTICCCISFGSIGYAVTERFLMATGKTSLSMIAQVSGALTNVVLDYVFIYPLKMGIAGAAYATVIGQILSLAISLVLHFAVNKEIGNNVKNLIPDKSIIKNIYKIGFPAFLMQGMLALTMFGMLLIISTINDVYTANLLSGSYGIYYKLMQMALFAAFGLSNVLISIVSYNYGSQNYSRVKQAVIHGIIASISITAVITVIFQAAAKPISALFALTLDESSLVGKTDVIQICVQALRVATLGYVFMGFSVAVQGILQGFNEVYSPLIISALRLLVFVLPIALIFTKTPNVATDIWWTFPIAEVLTAIFSFAFLKNALKRRKINAR